MTSQTKVNPSVAKVLQIVLLIGLTLSLIIIMMGGCLFLGTHAHEMVNDRVFHGEPLAFTSMEAILNATERDQAMAITQLGILILMATPMIRVFSCLILFAQERDLLYVALSLCVLAILSYSILA